MNSDELRALLLVWLEGVKAWGPETEQSWKDYIVKEGETPTLKDEYMIKVEFYTNDHKYTLTATTNNETRTYLGAIATERKPQAGTDWCRGNDLPDGEFSKETFDEIMRKIVGYELVAKKIKK